jgi:hypothetical protein
MLYFFSLSLKSIVYLLATRRELVVTMDAWTTSVEEPRPV